MLSNVQSGMQSRWGEDLAKIVFSDDKATMPPKFSAIGDKRSLRQYEGDFTNPRGGYPLRLRVRAGRLAMTWGEYPFWRPVSIIGRDELIAMADYTRMRVERDTAGHPVRILLTALDGSTKGAPVFSRAPS